MNYGKINKTSYIHILGWSWCHKELYTAGPFISFVWCNRPQQLEKTLQMNAHSDVSPKRARSIHLTDALSECFFLFLWRQSVHKIIHWSFAPRSESENHWDAVAKFKRRINRTIQIFDMFETSFLSRNAQIVQCV